jgi:hypothetical protein
MNRNALISSLALFAIVAVPVVVRADDQQRRDAPEPEPEPTPAPAPVEVEPAPEPAPVDPSLPQGVRGTIIDASTGEGMPAAEVLVLEGGNQTIVAELDGTFVLPLPPGRYVLNVFTPLYEQKRVTVTIKAGVFGELRVELAPTEEASETIEISGKIDTRSRSAALAVRRAATTVSDTISASEISKTPDSSAGDAIKRVVSVSVIDNRYVVLRGLEGRYVTTLLNGVALPSPEPDRNAVPLDLFPTSLLANLTVFKSYAAELPGQFGGGTLLLETNSYPSDFELKLGLSSGGSSVGTMRDGLVNASGGGFREAFGYPAGDRQLPSEVPDDMPASRRTMDRDALERVGESFTNIWSAGSDTYYPNFGFNAVVGDTVKVARRDLGYLASASMKRGFSLREGINRRTAVDGNRDVYVTEDIATAQGKLETTVGGLVNVGYQLTPDHAIEVFGLYTHIGENLTYKANGFSESEDTDIDLTRLGFIARDLAFAQITGDHRLSEDGIKLNWQGNAAITSRDELDSRDIIYNMLPDGATYEDDANSGQRYWSALQDRSYGGGVDVLIPVSNVRIKVGAQAQGLDRDFDGRRFRFRFVGMDPATRRLDAETMLSPEHIGPDFLPEETTSQEDSYRAGLSVLAGYASAEATLAPQLRVVGGLRYERANQTLENGSIFATAGVVLPEPIDRTESHPLPTGSVIVSPRSDMNVRFAYSRTLVRPKFREIAPFLYYDVVRRRNVSGTPDLKTTRIESADVRWEWFPGASEVIAASVFYKRFRDPIEQVVFNSADDIAFRNAPAGDMAGIEIEGKLELARFAKPLAAFNVGGNVALIQSSVDLDSGAAMLQTSRERPLYGQSPYVVNVGVEYVNPKALDVSVLYNVSGRRLVDIGIEGIPDTYEDAFHRVDLVLSRGFGDFKLKGSVSNLLNRRIELSQANVIVNEAVPGVAVSLGLEWIPK